MGKASSRRQVDGVVSQSRRRWCRGLAGAAAAGLLPRPARAHPVHETFTEAHHRRQKRLLEVSLRARPEDVQEALRHAGSPQLRIDAMQREAPAALARKLTAYLRRQFIFCDRRPQRMPMLYVGQELEPTWLWMHFAFPTGGVADLGGFHLDNRVFYEIAPSQVNTVLLTHGGATTSLRFQIGTTPDPIPSPT